jgi:hypothetical protein
LSQMKPLYRERANIRGRLTGQDVLGCLVHEL